MINFYYDYKTNKIEAIFYLTRYLSLFIILSSLYTFLNIIIYILYYNYSLINY